MEPTQTMEGRWGGSPAAADIELHGDRVLVEDRDVSARIRDEDVTELVSVISAHPEVRAALLEAPGSRRGRPGDVVIEGRDIGTAVAPDAPVKVFLTASPLERARRRAEQLGVADDPDEVAEIAAAIEERDLADAYAGIVAV